MMVANYKTKKALKEAIGGPLNYSETSIFGPEFRPHGSFCVVGPSAYNRKWFAQVTMEGCLIKKVS